MARAHPIAIMLGYGCGVSIPRTVDAEIIQQLRATIITRGQLAHWDSALWAILLLVGVIMDKKAPSARHRMVYAVLVASAFLVILAAVHNVFLPNI